MKAPEILSPAGSFEALKAAVENGADAVYLGGKEFNARKGAANFSRDELRAACEYAHLKGVNIYVTVNILLSDREMEEVGNFIDFLYSIGVDGIIVQDLGLGFFIKKNFQEMELHASTQMTIHNLESAKVLKELNFDRIVLARELSLEDIKEIKKETGLKIETFVHGALCFCYSGQCLMSSFIGARSGNRGQCAQPCRLPYTIVDNKARPLSERLHFLSPRDLNMIEYLPELIEAGIDSFKIEGRLKRPEYVAQVTAIYRKAVDSFLENPSKYRIGIEDKKRLAQIFNRDFTTGYYFKNPGSELMSIDCPRNKGVFLGKVTGFNVKTGMTQILLEDTLRVGDGVDFRGDDGFGYTVTRFFVDKKEVKEAEAGDLIEIKTKKSLPKGTPVYKTCDIKLMEHLEETYRNPKLEKKIPVDIEVTVKKGCPVQIKVMDEDGNISIRKTDYITEKAEKKPLEQRVLKEQIDRLGNTVFKLRKFTARIDDDAMVPFSIINELRRSAIKDIENQRIDAHIKLNPSGNWKEYLEKVYDFKKETTPDTGLKFSVRVSSCEAAEAAILAGADIIYYGGEDLSATFSSYKEAYKFARKNGREFFMVFPRIIKNQRMKLFNSLLDELQKNEVRGILAGNLGILNEAKKQGFEIIADFSLNVFNSLSINLLGRLGATRVILSNELTLNQIKEMNSSVEKECIVHGKIPLMVSEHNLIKSNLKDCERAFGLKDRIGKVFPVKIDEDGRTHIYNCDELCMINYLDQMSRSGINVMQLYLIDETPERVHKVVSAYVKTAKKEQEIDESEITPEFTHGHFFRGVL
ncbi:MAG TPA: U32 family peptidase [Thermoanaerobacterales bacterium]|nr:U32 family peptidase [Thermoanaerobacterales bacterium]